MAVQSTREIVLSFTGDVELNQVANAAINNVSPGGSDVINLASGANTITVPSGGSTPTGVTIIPPADNEETILLKKVTGDTGIGLHPTDPTSLALASGVTTFVLTAGGTITGLRLIWS